VISFLGGTKATINLSEILRRRLTISGSGLRPRSVEFKGAIARNLRERVWPLIASGKIKAVIHKTFALAEAAKAHELMESSQHIGKIVLTV
jgi:NADPH2:quinone reductase